MLDHLAVLKGLGEPRARKEVVRALLDRTNLYDVRKRKLGTFSGGMKQRFGIAQALLGEPKLIIVDEPTAGLDPAERLRFHNLLAEIGENIVVILSTHIVEDVSDLCSRMAIISGGRVLATGTPQDAIDRLRGRSGARSSGGTRCASTNRGTPSSSPASRPARASSTSWPRSGPTPASPRSARASRTSTSRRSARPRGKRHRGA